MARTKKTVFRSLPFERYIRSLAPNMRFSEDAIQMIQGVTEDYLVDVYRSAYEVVGHCGRNTIMQRDLALVRRIRGGL
jgi:histone H3/H4